MMALVVGWAVLLMLVLFGVIVLRALNQGRDVRAGIKIPFASFFFEAGDHDGNNGQQQPQTNAGKRAQN
jgi:hypothetical protein